MIQHTNRRTVLRTVGLALAGNGIVGTATADSSSFARQLNTVRAASQQYKDVSAARDDGYDAIVSPYEPGMGFHFANPAFVAADEDVPPDLETPAVLVYYTTGNYDPDPGDQHDPARDDDLRLGAVEFAHSGTEGADADYFDDENASRNVETPESEGWHYIPAADFTAVHVWVHRGNPAGVFHETNPTVD